MSISEYAKLLQDFRSQLDAWGVTAQGLIAVAVLSFFFFLLSAREVAGWFLKTGGLREEIRELRSQVNQLQKTLDAVHRIEEQPEHAEKKISAAAAGGEKASSLKTFRLDH